MNMVHDVLTACGYGMKEPFSFTYRWNDAEESRQVCPFVSEQFPDDVYLLVSLRPAELAHTRDNSFMSALAASFRKQRFHRSAMDRNTTLLMSCLVADGEQIDHEQRVQLEDDPYYFKKYVLVHTAEDEAAAQRYVAENCREGQTLPETIRSCLLNTTLFAAYKDNDPAPRAYRYFVELATKITVLPIRPDSEILIDTVDTIWNREIQNNLQIDLAAVETVLELDADEMLDKWIELTRVASC